MKKGIKLFRKNEEGRNTLSMMGVFMLVIIPLSGAITFAIYSHHQRNPPQPPPSSARQAPATHRMDEVLTAAQDGEQAEEGQSAFGSAELRSERNQGVFRFDPQQQSPSAQGSAFDQIVSGGTSPQSTPVAGRSATGPSRDPLSAILEEGSTRRRTTSETATQNHHRAFNLNQSGIEETSARSQTILISTYRQEPESTEDTPTPQDESVTIELPPDNYLPLGAYIPVILQTPFDTSNPDPSIQLQVSGSVKFFGRNRIPIGTKILASASVSGQYANSRVMMQATALLFPDGSTIPIQGIVRAEDRTVGLRGQFHDQPLPKRALDVLAPAGLAIAADRFQTRSVSSGSQTQTSTPSDAFMDLSRTLIERELEKIDQYFPAYVEVKPGTRGFIELHAPVDLTQRTPPVQARSITVTRQNGQSASSALGNLVGSNPGNSPHYDDFAKLIEDFPNLLNDLNAGRGIPRELRNATGEAVEYLKKMF